LRPSPPGQLVSLRHSVGRRSHGRPGYIEQTADVFRGALDTNDDILEHHSSFDWERANDTRAADDEGADGLKKLRLAAENWDVPIVVTTAVQFYESLFANRTSRCRKLHNLAKSVIVIDEAQMMPLKLLLPSMAAIEELATNYGASIVLCTATQPALRRRDGFEGGFAVDDHRELAPEPKRLYAELKRFDIEWKGDPVTDDDITVRCRSLHGGADRNMEGTYSPARVSTSGELYPIIAFSRYKSINSL
jgi:CRISPR-associated endonuclease/helicase Cas3